MVGGLEFDDGEINAARDSGQLLSMDLELSKICNLNCKYCYKENNSEKEIELNDIFSVIEQGAELGVKRINVIGGGEPLLFKDLIEVIDKIKENRINCTVVTNGTLIDEKTAKMLFDKKVDVVVKFNSFREEVQDFLAEKEGTHKKIKQAIALLQKEGYGKEKEPEIAVHTIVCKKNYDEIIEIYDWARKNNIQPYIEAITLQGNAKDNKELWVNPRELFALFESLQKIDLKKYGISWPLIPPIAGQCCKRMFYNVYITSTGEVQPCAGVNVSGGNIEDKSIKDIISDSNIFKITRNIDKHIQGKCKECEHSEYCYGCRGNAYQCTGDVTASDPGCWNNFKEKNL